MACAIPLLVRCPNKSPDGLRHTAFGPMPEQITAWLAPYRGTKKAPQEYGTLQENNRTNQAITLRACKV
jgi:hypothetical protein